MYVHRETDGARLRGCHRAILYTPRTGDSGFPWEARVSRSRGAAHGL